MSPLEPVPVPAALRGLRLAVLVSGGIAAYKVADLVSQLVQAGCQVRVGMTAAAVRFVSPLTFRALSGREVAVDLWGGEAPEPHVELGDWAQLALVAPATANTLAAIAQGRADDLVSATVLAARCPVVVAPAMNDAMWSKPAVAENVAALRRRGLIVVEPETGRLASGHSGTGRLAGPAALLAALERASPRRDLEGRRVVVSAGGTREPIDPVRYIGNYSSGKMGHGLAVAAARRGARVALVTTAPPPEEPGLEVHRVETAAEMLVRLRTLVADADLLAMAAAVADFRPVRREPAKLRREERDRLVLELERNVDVLAALVEQGGERMFKLGFAAEDAELDERARAKLERKRLDAIFANDISQLGVGMGADDNAGVLLFRDGSRVEFGRMPKTLLADRLLDVLLPRLPARP